MSATARLPRRGEIWFTQLSVDPPGKGKRPVIVVSHQSRNLHPKADTVLVVPLSTSIQRSAPTDLLLAAGETGLSADCVARAENVTTLRKTDLSEPRARLRPLSERHICELAAKVRIAMGC